MSALSLNKMQSSSMQMFASFKMGNSEIALSVSALQEVVNYPEKIVAVPLAPPFLTGLFNLRGVIIPIVDMAKFLDLESTVAVTAKKIAIVTVDQVRVGLLFDCTSEILNVPESDISAYNDHTEGPLSVIRSVLKLNEGERIIEVIDPPSLLKIQNIPEIISKNKSEVAEISKKKSKRSQCISFRAGTMEFGVEISAIREIIKVPEIKRTVLTVDFCIGMVTLRGMVIPILDFKKFIHSHSDVVEDQEARRIVVLKIQNIQVGFLVDSVDSIVTYFEEEVMPIPMFQQERAEMMKGMLPEDKSSKVIILNSEKMLTDDEVVAITRGHASLYGSTEEQNKKKNATERKPYISFKLDYLLSTRLNTIDEIAKVTETLMRPPGYPEFVAGMMSMRGEIVMIVDLRAYYGMTPTQDPMESRILVVKGSKGKFGLLVDSVESIDTVDEGMKVQIPAVLAQGVAKRLQGDMKEVVEMTDMVGNKKTYMILSVPDLVQKLEAGAV